MKTISTTINGSDGWVNLATRLETSFSADDTITVQPRGAILHVALSDETPTGSNYIEVRDCEKFSVTFDGTNDLYVKTFIGGCVLAVS